MPTRSRQYRHYDEDDSDSGADYPRGRDRARPRAHRSARSPSHGDGYYDRRPRSSRRRDEYYSHDEDDDYYHHSSGDDSDAQRRRRRRRRPSLRTGDHAQRREPRRQHTTPARPGHRRRHDGDRSRSRDWHQDEDVARERKNQAIRSALAAGAVEAMRQRNRPGDWLGARGLHVATAAMSAAAFDSAVDRNPRRRGKTKLVTSALGGLLVDNLASGIRGRR